MTDHFRDWTLSASNGEVTINGTTDTLSAGNVFWARLGKVLQEALEQKLQIRRMAAGSGLTDAPGESDVERARR